MSKTEKCYTYHAGKKLELDKQPESFVVRALPNELYQAGFENCRQVSSASTRITGVKPDELDNSMQRARDIAVAHHAYAVSDSGEEFLITDRVFVIFPESASAEEISELAGRYGLLMKERFSEHEFLFQLTNATGMNPLKLVVKLTEDEPLVISAEHDLNYRATTASFNLPIDPAYARQWHLHTDFSNTEYDARTSSRCQSAWQLLDGFGSADVVVGVTDDGCQLDHSDFDSIDMLMGDKFADWAYLEGTDLISGDSIGADPDKMYQQGANHGTSCAGVIAAELDAQLTVGAAPGCKLLPIKWQSEGPSLFISSAKLYKVLRFVANKVDVLSNSWGITPASRWPGYVTDYIEELAETGGRRGKGLVFLWAAGNENCPINHTGNLDIPYSNGWVFQAGHWQWAGVQTSRVFVNDLVGLKGVMHIAALSSTARRSHYSNYGSGITICAPSSNSHAYFRLPVKGLGITTTTGPTNGSNAPVTDQFGGTSSATPLAAGVAALVISANPSLHATEIISILKRTASKDLDMASYPKTPPASYDPDPNWDISPAAPYNSGEFQDINDTDGTWSPWFGHGRIDAFEAVKAALAISTPDTDTLRFESTPGKTIPDDDPIGIEERIQVNNNGIVQDLRVELDIEHTWIGDLQVRLSAPDGSSLLLHDRGGASTDNIRRNYDLSNLPELGLFVGRPITGEWVLFVRDLAGADVGMLKQYALEFSLDAGSVQVEDNQSVSIPDNDPQGISRSLLIDNQIVIRNISVAVDITHPWIGDLKVSLHSPQGDEIQLHDRSGSSNDNIIHSWRADEFPALNTLIGKQSNGEWRLSVADLAGRDIGKLNRWGITISA